jgi:predicted CXXCH cytochrome family protein
VRRELSVLNASALGRSVGALLLAVSTLAAAQSPAQAPAKGYLGATACKECHGAAYDAWSRSHHKLAMQPADATTVLGDFKNAKFTYAGTTSTFSTRGGKYFVRTDGPDGKLADFEIKYTFGVDPLQQYLIELPGGRLQALGIAWDTRPKAQGGQRWFHLYPDQKLHAGEPLHWAGVDQNWNFMCAECHSTALRKNFDATKKTFATAWTEINVACEACHGPGADHVAWAQAKKIGKAYPGGGNGLVVALDERRSVTWSPVASTGNAQRSVPRETSREIVTCAVCHARAARISDEIATGKPLQDSHRLARLDEGLYYPDGQIRDEVYEWGSFVQSRMNAKGVTCSDCHDPHSLSLRQPGNAVCATCHQAAKYDAPSHTHHTKGSAGAACVACHMPTTTYMRIDARHDHSLRIPRPELSGALGAPSACGSCHAKNGAQWAADAIKTWTGKAPGGFQAYGNALHAGDLGAPGARGALLTVLDDSNAPAIARASAIDRLGRMLSPSTLPAVTRALNDSDSVVRLAAVEAIGGTDPETRVRYLTRMLNDPVKAVRIEAARVLAGPAEGGIPNLDRGTFQRALDEYVATQVYNADRPEAHLNLGNLYVVRGDPADGIAEYRQAIVLDPTSVATRVNLADVYRAQGSDAESVAVLREGLAKAPKSAALHHALGLALVREKRSADALRELAEASKLAPDDARFAYVNAVALNDAGKKEEALRVLSAALKAHPYDRDVLVALAYFSAAAGQHEAAIRYAKTLAELDPENPEYARLGAALAATPRPGPLQ